MARPHTIPASAFALSAVLAFAGFSVPAHAAPPPAAGTSLVAFEYHSTMDFTEVGGGPDTPVHITYRFSPTWAPFSSTNTSAEYGPLERMVVEVGGECVAMSGDGTSIGVFDNAGTTIIDDSYRVAADLPAVIGRKLFGMDLSHVSAVIADEQETMFNDTSLPTNPLFADQADYQQLVFQLVDPATNERTTLVGNFFAPFQLGFNEPWNGPAYVQEAVNERSTGGVRIALSKPLEKAIGYFHAYSPNSIEKAFEEMELFIKQVEAHRRVLGNETADLLTELARQVIDQEAFPRCA